MKEAGVPVFQTSIVEGAAYCDLFDFGGTLQALDSAQTSNITKAIDNDHEIRRRIGRKDQRGDAMSGKRVKIRLGEALSDIGSFEPSKRGKPTPEPQAAGFTRREPSPALEPADPPKVQRRRGTGRNAKINIKAKPETLDQFYAAADAMGLGVGEALEIALNLLQKKYPIANRYQIDIEHKFMLGIVLGTAGEERFIR